MSGTLRTAQTVLSLVYNDAGALVTIATAGTAAIGTANLGAGSADIGRVGLLNEVTQIQTFTTASGDATSAPITGLGKYSEADILVDITDVGGTVPTIDVLVDGRLDGTGFTNIAHLTQIGTISKLVAHLSKKQSVSDIEAVQIDAGEGSLRAIGWGDAMRTRIEIAGTSPSFTGRVWVNFVA